MSPFVVQSEEDKGYVATDTLSGTRIKTELRDIGASISVVNQQFLQDLGAVRADDLLTYTTGTEVVGIQGNYSGSVTNGGLQAFQSDRTDSTPTTRLRGLDRATFARNHTQTSYNFDSYNIERIEINRGANAILFGLASPSGIINAVTRQANLRQNQGSVDLRVDNYGSWRASLDYNKALVKDRLALRVDLMKDQRIYEQEPAHRDERRGYIAITAKPFSSMTFRANAETGKLFEVQPMINPPGDGITTFYLSGQRTSASNILSVGGVTNRAGQYPGTPANVDPYSFTGRMGDWFWTPGAIFSNPNSSAVDQGYPAFGRNGNAPAAQRIEYRMSASNTSNEYQAYLANPLANFLVADQIIDRSIYDYRKRKLEGDVSSDQLDFTAYDLSLEQLFLEGTFGAELHYAGGEGTKGNFSTSNNPYGDVIFIDQNQLTTDGRPNPNLGRPFRSSTPAARYYDYDYSDLRVTGFARLDFRKFSSRWLGQILGDHTWTAFYNQTKNTDENRDYRPVLGGNYIDGQGSSLATARTINVVQYLGPSVIGTASPSGLRIPGVTTSQFFPSSLAVWHQYEDTNRTWQLDTFPVLFSPETTAISGSKTRQKVESSGFIWHAKMFGGNIVPTLGWRNDQTEDYRINAPFGPNNFVLVNDPAYQFRATPDTALDVNIFSWGAVAHLPKFIERKLPWGMSASAHYNESENFSAQGVRTNVLREPLPPPLGFTKEYGFSLGLLDHKFNLRVTKYETTQENIDDPRLGANFLAQIEMRVWNFNPASTVEALGYVGAGSANLSDIYKRFLQALEFEKLTPRDDGTTPVRFNGAGLNAVTSSESKGVEIELVANPTKNWRLALNVTQQKASRGPVDPLYKAIYDDRLAQWTKPGVYQLSGGPGGPEDTLDGRIAALVDSRYLKAVLSEGQNVNELREWRWNLVTNYTFDRDGLFKGFSMGTGLRWQDKPTIGFMIMNDPALGLVEDPTHPIFGPTELLTDLWFNYRLPFLKKRFKGWTVGLRVQNVLNDGLLVPVRANPVAIGSSDFVIPAYRIGVGRTWQLSTRFEF